MYFGVGNEDFGQPRGSKLVKTLALELRVAINLGQEEEIQLNNRELVVIKLNKLKISRIYNRDIYPIVAYIPYISISY